MSYTAPKTWVAGNLWTSSDANKYIRDQFVSTRRWVNSTGAASDFTAGFTSTSPVMVGAGHTNLMTSTPDEDFRMMVLGVFQTSALSGAAQISVSIKDQGGANITTGGVAMSVDFGADAFKTFVVSGALGYTGGAQQGFTWWANVDAGSCDFRWDSFWWFSPVT